MTESRRSLEDLKMRGDFIRRHIGPGENHVAEMLATLGLSSLEEMIDKTVPAAIRNERPLELDNAMSERMMLSTLRRIAARNKVFISMIGMGYVPADLASSGGSLTVSVRDAAVAVELVDLPFYRRTPS